MAYNKTRPVPSTSDNKTNSMWKVTDYVNEVDRLKKQLEEVKANADYQIEGRELEKKELLGIIQGKDKAIAELKAQIEALETRCNELFFQVNEQNAQIEKMKCCAICKKYGTVETGADMQLCYTHYCNSVCNDWQLKE